MKKVRMDNIPRIEGLLYEVYLRLEHVCPADDTDIQQVSIPQKAGKLIMISPLSPPPATWTHQLALRNYRKLRPQFVLLQRLTKLERVPFL